MDRKPVEIRAQYHGFERRNYQEGKERRCSYPMHYYNP